MLPRKASRLLLDAGWTSAENNSKMLATIMGESNLFSHAYHWNSPADGGDGSTDWGPFQLNDGNKGGQSPVKGPDGLPVPVEGGIKKLSEVKAFAEMACDPQRAAAHARAMYEARGFQPWVAGPYYPHADGGGWKKHYPAATYAMRNMLHEMLGFPLA
jgi:hypothetical protein